MSWEREIEENGQWTPYDPNQTDPYGNTNQGGPDPSTPTGVGPIDEGYVDPHIAETQRRYNGGSPPDQPLQSGYGWEWDGWDWNQVQGRGLGWGQPVTNTPVTTTTPTTTTPGPTPGPTVPRGFVPPISAGGGGYGGPSSTLPADIAALFGKVPEKTPVQSAYQDALLKYMGKAQQTPSLDDPTLAPQVEVFRASNQRATERNRRSAAERAAATGQSESGYLDNLIAQGVQQQGFNESSFNANLLGGEMNKRREELKAALQLAAATGDAEAARELQTRLAQVSAMMQQQGLNLQGQLGFGDLDLRRTLGLEQLNQNALQLIMGAL